MVVLEVCGGTVKSACRFEGGFTMAKGFVIGSGSE